MITQNQYLLESSLGIAGSGRSKLSVWDGLELELTFWRRIPTSSTPADPLRSMSRKEGGDFFMFESRRSRHLQNVLPMATLQPGHSQKGQHEHRDS